MIDIWQGTDGSIFGLVPEEVVWDKRTGLLIEYPVICVYYPPEEPSVLKVNYRVDANGQLRFKEMETEPLPSVNQPSGEIRR